MVVYEGPHITKTNAISSIVIINRRLAKAILVLRSKDLTHN